MLRTTPLRLWQSHLLGRRGDLFVSQHTTAVTSHHSTPHHHPHAMNDLHIPQHCHLTRHTLRHYAALHCTLLSSHVHRHCTALHSIHCLAPVCHS